MAKQGDLTIKEWESYLDPRAHGLEEVRDFAAPRIDKLVADGSIEKISQFAQGRLFFALGEYDKAAVIFNQLADQEEVAPYLDHIESVRLRKINRTIPTQIAAASHDSINLVKEIGLVLGLFTMADNRKKIIALESAIVGQDGVEQDLKFRAEMNVVQLMPDTLTKEGYRTEYERKMVRDRFGYAVSSLVGRSVRVEAQVKNSKKESALRDLKERVEKANAKHLLAQAKFDLAFFLVSVGEMPEGIELYEEIIATFSNSEKHRYDLYFEAMNNCLQVLLHNAAMGYPRTSNRIVEYYLELSENSDLSLDWLFRNRDNRRQLESALYQYGQSRVPKPSLDKLEKRLAVL